MAIALASPGVLVDLVGRHKAGEPVGIYSVCSANALVIQAAMRQAGRNGTYVLIEATCNQVNQFGGYSGMTPADFAGMVRQIAARSGFAEERILLGGDHLGPYPWQDLPVQEAMANAAAMIQAYAAAGFGKLHLDASMPCLGDAQNGPLEPDLIAERSAQLCRVAEMSRVPGISEPVYVVGTDIPAPGGAQEADLALGITAPTQLRGSLEALRRAFEGHGLSDAWNRVMAVVVQPGVEFGDEGVHEYDRQAAAPLSRFIEQLPALVYEAHSTDYQRAESLRALVEDHFAILKVGPGLTFAMREAIFALAHMEMEWLGNRADVRLSHLIEVIDGVMERNPRYWRSYYHGDAAQIALARKYSRSDRIRYYWTDPEVTEALDRLVANLEAHPVPLTLLSQFLPVQYQHVSAGLLENRPFELILDKVMEVLQDYAAACGRDTIRV